MRKLTDGEQEEILQYIDSTVSNKSVDRSKLPMWLVMLLERAEKAESESAALRERMSLLEHDLDIARQAAKGHQERASKFNAALAAANEDAAFHPRAAKLMRKRKNFIVIACDEPYFMDAYDLIRDEEIQKGTWTVEDQWHYDDAKAAHRARVASARVGEE